MQRPVKHLGFLKTPVETVAKFRQVAGQMLGADPMVDASDIAFNIGDQGMDPGQDLRRLLPRHDFMPLSLASAALTLREGSAASHLPFRASHDKLDG